MGSAQYVAKFLDDEREKEATALEKEALSKYSRQTHKKVSGLEVHGKTLHDTLHKKVSGLEDTLEKLMEKLEKVEKFLGSASVV